MKLFIHSRRFCSFFFGLAALAAFGISAASAQSPSLLRKAPEAQSLIGTASNKGTVRVIVQYLPAQGPARATLGTVREDIDGIMAENRAAQDAIAALHLGPVSQIAVSKAFKGFSITPGFAATVTAAELELLASDPRVVAIENDTPEPPQLLQSLPLIGMTGAYSYGADATRQAVAVLDTGSEYTHKFLNGKLSAEGCFSTTQGTYGTANGSISVCPGGAATSTAAGSGLPCPVSVSGCEHGTHVAGIAVGKNTEQGSGQPTNGAGMNGRLIAVQVFSQFNDTTDCGTGTGASPCVLSFTSDQIAGLNYVYSIRNSLANQVKIAAVNMSLGGGHFSGNCDATQSTRKAAIDQLRAAGIATFIAAGNGSSRSQIGAPACISSAIAVAASKKDGDAVASYSDLSTQVAIFAPGGDFTTLNGASSPTGPILSSVPAGFNAPSFGFNCNYTGSAPSAGGTYCHLAGTSMATPTAAGAFAAIRAACPTATIDTILNAFIVTGVSITDTRSGNLSIAKPRIQVDRAAVQACGFVSVLAVSPATDTTISGQQGGPFTPSAASYLVGTSDGIANYTISGVPAWLTPSATSGTAYKVADTVTFTTNAAANALAPGTYTATISFTNTSNGQGNTTRTVNLTVLAPHPVIIAESNNIVTSGNQGGPFSPGSFTYNLTTTPGSIGYTVSNVPSWLTASSTSGTLSSVPTPITFTVNASANSLPVGTQSATINFAGADGGTATRVATISVNGTVSGAGTTIVAAVLPNARTTIVGTPVTAFATIINTGAVTATGCFIAPPASLPGSFLYQTTDAGNNATGTPNTPVDIPAGQPKSFYFAITPSQVGTLDLPLIYGCTNAVSPVSVPGLNTFLLSTTATPISDMLSIANTLTGDGNLGVAGPSGQGVMVTAAINIGTAGTVTFTPTVTPAGAATRTLPVTLTVCPSNPSAICTSPPSSSFTTSVAASQILTFNVYVQGQGTLVPYDPANNRVFLVAQEGSTPVGETSAALKMTAAPDPAMTSDTPAD
jgi:hypothetical protein